MNPDFQNAFEEARAKLASMNHAPVGEGPFQAILRRAYHCKATDAVAGSYVASHQCFKTEEQLQAYIDGLGLKEDDETKIDIIRPGSVDSTTPTVKPAEVNPDESPF